MANAWVILSVRSKLSSDEIGYNVVILSFFILKKYKFNISNFVVSRCFEMFFLLLNFAPE
jgi:hypothetical protein